MDKKIKEIRRGNKRTSDQNYMANTRYLTRIIVCLSELKEPITKTYLCRNLLVGRMNTIGDAINWLSNNGIIIGEKNRGGTTLYKINPEFLEFKKKHSIK